MRSTLQSIRARRGQKDHGFTLIELLVVVVIIGVLIAIAIPLYLNYQKSSHDKAADSDVRNAAVVVQQCYSDTNSWVTDWAVQSGDTAYTSSDCPGGTINASPDSVLVFSASADGDGVIIKGWNGAGHGYVYTFDTSKGGSVAQSTTTQTAAPTAS